MGFRFRKSLRIFKGLSVTLSGAGVGVRAGIPALNVSAGPSGPALNVGIPGSGVGYRVSGGRGRSSYREVRAALRAQREAEAHAARTREILDAAREHAAGEAVIDGLAGVLKGRNRKPLDFPDLLRARGPYVPAAFQPAPYEANPAWLGQRSAVAFPLWRWLLMLGVGGCGGLSILDGSAEYAGGLGLVAVTAGGFLARQLARRGPYRVRLDAHKRAEHEAEDAARGRDHDAAERRRGEERAREEAHRARLREAVAQGNPEPLVDLLEAELANEDWPVAVVAEVEFDGMADAVIELELPELDDVPEERTALTQRGKVSRKAMAKRDRVAIYEDLCCGVALRLAYEAFRVVPTLQRVRLRGMATGIGATGQEDDFVALTLDLERDAMAAFDLDRLDPSTAVTSLGRWGGNKKGELRAVA